jgi:hypothetical protein
VLNPWQQRCLEYADETLTEPPRWAWTKRVQGRGTLVQRFVLPLALCPTLNAFAEMPAWRRKKIKDAVGLQMLVQAGTRFRVPLAGRPLVLAIRFSCRESDDDSSWMKFAIDRLTPNNGGLGLIRDDKPSAVERASWVEYAKRGSGFCLVECWSGEKPKKRRRA